MLKHHQNLLRIAVVVLCVCMSMCGSGLAQTITANIGGTVTDAAGSVIPGAKITATNVATNVSVSTTSNNSGSYSIRFLQIGTYKISIEAKGFSKSVFGPYTLEIDQIAKVDAQLKAGSANDTVEVSSGLAPLLNTDNSQIDATFDTTTIENFPLAGQNFAAMMVFMPGAVATQPAGFNSLGSVERCTGSSCEVSVNGNRMQANNYLWDGVEVNETFNNLPGYAPSPDAIGEMKVVTANPNAEYGNASGGDVIMTMKSGTNQFHGSAFGHFQNQLLNANSWVNKHNGAPFAPRSIVNQYVFGGTVGGPIWKDKLFFFADFAAGRTHSSNSQLLYLITAKMRTGDFSELLDPNLMCATGDSATACNAKKIQLYDSQNNFTPYANNQNIPIINPVAKYLYAHPEVYPEPNHTPDAGCPTCENFAGTAKSFNKYDQGDVKVDYVLSSKDRLFAHYTQAEGLDDTANPVAVFFQNGDKFPDKVAAVSDVHTFSTSIVNEFRAGYSRIRWEAGDPFDPSGEFGLHGNSTVGICNGCTQPYQGFSGQNASYLNTPGNPASPQDFVNNIFEYTDSLTWAHGKHVSKAGAELIRYQQNDFEPGPDGGLGNFSYRGAYTSNPTASAIAGVGSGGYAPADFVLNRVVQAAIGSVTGPNGQRQYRNAYYAQDDWRVTPKLTLNLGVRYEYDQPVYEVNNKTANLDLATQTVLYAGSVPALNTFTNPGICSNRACYNPTYDNIMPRIGFAYQLDPNTVVRGGYGSSAYLEGTGTFLRLTFNPPFQPSSLINASLPAAASGTIPATGGSPRTVQEGFGTQANGDLGAGGQFRAYSPSLRPSVTGTYSLSLQHQINNHTTFTLSYVGESGRHLIQAVWANQLRQPCLLNGSISSDPNTAACTAVNPAPEINVVGQNGAVRETASEGTFNYNALQAVLRQRAVKGISYTVNYTFARAMTNTDGFFGVPDVAGPSPYAENAYDNSAEYGPVGQDIRNNLNGFVTYELPYGHNRQFGADAPVVLQELLGGWNVSMTGVAYSGLPLTPSSYYNYAATNNNNNRPNMYFNIPVKHRSVNNWFGNDPSAIGCSTPGATVNAAGVLCAYGTAGIGTYGTVKPNSLRGPGFSNLDASLSKQFRIYREHNIGMTVEAFNVLNHASYDNPYQYIEDANFGHIYGTRSTERHLQISAHYTF